MERLALRLCALAVLHPWLQPSVRPVARWLLARLEDNATRAAR